MAPVLDKDRQAPPHFFIDADALLAEFTLKQANPLGQLACVVKELATISDGAREGK